MSKKRLFLSALFLLMVITGCKTTKVYQISIQPDPRVNKYLTPAGDGVTFEKEGIWGAVKPVTYEDFNHPPSINSGWDFQSPFEGLYDEYHMPIVFYLKIENRSDLSISFNPNASFSLFFENAPLFPIQYDELYQDLYTTRGGEARLENIRRMLMRSYLTLGPGEDAWGLLLFRRPEERKIKSEEIMFLIRRIYMAKKQIDVTVPFRIDMKIEKIPKTPMQDDPYPF